LFTLSSLSSLFSLQCPFNSLQYPLNSLVSLVYLLKKLESEKEKGLIHLFLPHSYPPLAHFNNKHPSLFHPSVHPKGGEDEVVAELVDELEKELRTQTELVRELKRQLKKAEADSEHRPANGLG
jgi:hypothetical protein